jgi:triphosphoribosyl-dephospho-CoA synthase
VHDAAVEMAAHLQAAESPAVLLPDLLAWDAGLKRDGINPGTSADLTVAVLFAERLNGILAAKA